MDPLSMFECSVCCEPFDGDEHRPKFVSCGHTFCKSCLQQIAASDGILAKCPEDRNEINIGSPTHLMDNKFIMSWVEELKSRHQVEARAAGESGQDRRCREAVLQELQLQVEAAVSQFTKPSGNSSPGALKLDQELRLLTCPEPVSVSSSSWRAEDLQLSEEPALRLAMLLLMHRGKLQELGIQQTQHQQEARPVQPARLEVEDVALCCVSAPGEETKEKNRLLQRNSPIHVLIGVSWESDPDWVKALLLRHASTLQELQVTSLCSIGATALSCLPKLRNLSLSRVEYCRAVPERWLGRLQSLEVSGHSCEAQSGLLRAHRDSLQEVQITSLGRPELLELQRMPALRSLGFVWVTGDCVLPGPWQGSLQQMHVKSSYLEQEGVRVSVLRAHRESLQDVRLDGASREMLLQVQQMPALQKLRLGFPARDLKSNPVLPEVWLCQLQEMRLSFALPRETLRSVVYAHRRSLLHLAVRIDPQDDKDASLPALLRGCGLQRLRTLELTRFNCKHPPACKAQLAECRDALPGCTVTCCGDTQLF